jgi:hypothetical protein
VVICGTRSRGQSIWQATCSDFGGVLTLKQGASPQLHPTAGHNCAKSLLSNCGHRLTSGARTTKLALVKASSGQLTAASSLVTYACKLTSVDIVNDNIDDNTSLTKCRGHHDLHRSKCKPGDRNAVWQILKLQTAVDLMQTTQAGNYRHISEARARQNGRINGTGRGRVAGRVRLKPSSVKLARSASISWMSSSAAAAVGVLLRRSLSVLHSHTMSMRRD